MNYRVAIVPIFHAVLPLLQHIFTAKVVRLVKLVV